jgi:cytochrome P450
MLDAMTARVLTAAQQVQGDQLVDQFIGATGAEDPYPLYRQLRELAPVFASHNMVLVSSYRHVVEVLRSQRIGQGPEEWSRIRKDPRFDSSAYLQAVADSIMFSDPPRHTRLRKLVSRGFTPRAVAESVDSISVLVKGLTEELADRAEFDVVSDYAEKIPVRVVCDLLGIPGADHPTLVHWTHEISKASNPVVTDEMIASANVAMANFTEYAAALTEERRATPGDDMVSVLVSATADGDLLTAEEFATQLMSLIAAGTETTINLIGNSIVNLQRWPDERAQLRDDPSLDEGAVEEFLRFDPPLQMTFPRLALEPLDIGDVHLETGDVVVSLLASANRDPEIVTDPDVLDVDRVRPSALQQLAFGGGIHLCLGAALARLEGRIAIRALLDNFPKMEVDLGAVVRGGNAMLRGYRRVPVSVSP